MSRRRGFSGGSSLRRRAASDDGELRRAMTYGSVLGSFCVEEFGTERVSRLTRDEIDERYGHFRRITAIEGIAAG